MDIYRPRIKFDTSDPAHEGVRELIERFGSKVISRFLRNQLISMAEKFQSEGLSPEDLDGGILSAAAASPVKGQES